MMGGPAMPSPPADSPYWRLPDELRETLERSFHARVAGRSGLVWLRDGGSALPRQSEAALNLDNGFWGGAPESAWQAAENAGAEWVSLLVRVYQRIAAIDPSHGLWRQLEYLRNGWWGGSGGFKVVYRDPPEVRRRLDALVDNTHGPPVCRDQLLGSLEHQLAGSARALLGELVSAPRRVLDPRAEPPDADTWREVGPPGEEALHFCVSREDLKPGRRALLRHVRLDDIHLDWRSPVAGIGAHRRCQYVGGYDGLRHWAQAKLHVGPPPFWLHGTDGLVERLQGARPSLSGELAVEVDALCDEWLTQRLHLAVLGREGLGAAARFHGRAAALAGALRRRV
jgi:hypothetical protein